MAEILLSLTIIGVVAAITLPSLTGNINERTWNTQRKALYARMSQAIALMPALNGYGVGATDAYTIANAAETFVTSGLSKVLKINNICDNEHLFDCGLSSQIVDVNGTKQDLPMEIRSLNPNMVTTGSADARIKNTKAVAFETANGESILTFYNPGCKAANVMISGADTAGNTGFYVKQQICVNFIFDLNGKKGPNTIGKDIGTISVAYPSDSKVVMPMYPKYLASGSKTYAAAAAYCGSLEEGEYRLPNIEELLSLYYNRAFYGGWDSGKAWSTTSVDSTQAYAMGYSLGIKYPRAKTNAYNVVCVKR